MSAFRIGPFVFVGQLGRGGTGSVRSSYTMHRPVQGGARCVRMNYALDWARIDEESTRAVPPASMAAPVVTEHTPNITPAESAPIISIKSSGSLAPWVERGVVSMVGAVFMSTSTSCERFAVHRRVARAAPVF